MLLNDGNGARRDLVRWVELGLAVRLGAEFHRPDHADGTRVPDEGEPVHPRHSLGKTRCQPFHVADDVALLHQLLRAQGHGRADRMRRIGVAMAEDAERLCLSGERVIDTVRHQHGRDRKIGR